MDPVRPGLFRRQDGSVLTDIALEVLRKRFPHSDNPVKDWLPGRPDWEEGLPDLNVLKQELIDLRTRNGKIVLYGHDDMDGITGLFIGLTILRGEGYTVIPIIPNSSTDDYGIRPARMKGILESGDLLLTVDYGCSAVKGVSWAVEQGARVVITDHHLLNPPLPPAHGLIDPQIFGLPGTVLAGCAVLYAALISIYPRWENRSNLLAAVALGTVADRVPLSGWNRYLLAEFSKINIGKLTSGMRKFIDEWPARGSTWTGLIVRQKIISVIGKGEGGGIDRLLEFMMSYDEKSIVRQWTAMRKTSKKRSRILSNYFTIAMQNSDEQAAAYGMTLIYMDSLPPGMGGALANRISKIDKRSVIVVSQRKNGVLGGEARSVGDWNVAEFLTGMKDVFTSAGGHKMAAGFSCKDKSWEELREVLLSRMTEYPAEYVMPPHIDLQVDELPDPNEFKCLAPFGPGFLPPAVKKNSLRYLLHVSENTVSWRISDESGD